jgi:hypothetical protein
MKATHFSETSVDFQRTTQRYFQEDVTLRLPFALFYFVTTTGSMVTNIGRSRQFKSTEIVVLSSVI